MIDLGAFGSLLSRPELDQSGRIFGVVIGVVTNNQDPDGLGRVKVQLPWLSDKDETNWARVVSPMAGNDRGLYLLPEVGDEVLVAFEHGMATFPYVLGSLWNGKEKPPEKNDDGKNNMRSLKSRSGHIIRLDDTDGGEKIEILDKSGENTIVIDTSQNTITITADADITISSSHGKLTLKAEQDVSIESSSGKLALAGLGVEVSSQAGVKVEANQNVELTATGQMNIKGATVNIN
jgi:uncharacterized protein involved in type VI secretion and phage assembly